MRSWLTFYKREMFLPTGLSVVINPYFFLRRGLARAIRQNAHFLNGNLLDFGCGTKPYKSLLAVSSYIGLDIPINGSQLSERDVDVFYDGFTIPFPDRHFDSILASEVLEHVFNLDTVLREMHRVLKQGGALLITVPFVWEEHGVPYDFARYTSFGLKHLLEEHGFQVVHAERVTPFVETIFQMWNAYLTSLLASWPVVLRLPVRTMLTFPFNVLGVVASLLLPRSSGLYSSNVVVAQKL